MNWEIGDSVDSENCISYQSNEIVGTVINVLERANNDIELECFITDTKTSKGLLMRPID